MSNKAVFLDRDHTLIEDPGYINDPSLVKLLPGVEVAIKSLLAAGYKIVVVTNQSGIARGLLTEEDLEKIHAELRQQLIQRGANLDGIYYCPFHPEGTVEEYSRDSELRKPKPGMLLKAAAEMDIDLSASWMVGDSPRDVEAGQRAGCRTIRIRTLLTPGGEATDEDVQADFIVRNLVDAAKIILREGPNPPPSRNPAFPKPAKRSPFPESAGSSPAEAPAAQVSQASSSGGADSMNDSEIRREILRTLRQVARSSGEEFSFVKLAGGISQVLAIVAFLGALWKIFDESTRVQDLQLQLQQGIAWAMVAIFLQLMALTFFMVERNK